MKRQQHPANSNKNTERSSCSSVNVNPNSYNGDTCITTDNITILTEEEYAERLTQRKQQSLQQAKSSPPIIAGRWSIHCSCSIVLHRIEQQLARQYIHDICHIIQWYYPNYVGTCTLLAVSKKKATKKNKSRTVESNCSNQKTITTNKNNNNNHLVLQQHISLTRPDICLHTNHIESFMQQLTKEIHFSLLSRTGIQLSKGTTTRYNTVQFDIPPSLKSFFNGSSSSGTSTISRKRKKKVQEHLQDQILHNPTKTKSFLIWRVATTDHHHGQQKRQSLSSLSILPLLSNCCNTVLTKQYQQSSYHYNDDDNNKSQNKNNENTITTHTDPDHVVQNHKTEPIYHISLARFEPCLYDYITTKDDSIPTIDKKKKIRKNIRDMPTNNNTNKNQRSENDEKNNYCTNTNDDDTVLYSTIATATPVNGVADVNDNNDDDENAGTSDDGCSSSTGSSSCCSFDGKIVDAIDDDDDDNSDKGSIKEEEEEDESSSSSYSTDTDPFVHRIDTVTCTFGGSRIHHIPLQQTK